MHPIFVVSRDPAAVAIRCVTPATWTDIRAGLDVPTRAFADAAGFEPRAGRHLLLPARDGSLAGVLFGLDAADNPARDPFAAGALPGLLPNGTYRLDDPPGEARLAALAFALGSYRFSRYRKRDDKEVRLALPDGVDGEDLSRIVEGVFLARDLINTPTNDMGPAELEAAARQLAGQHGATVRSIVGDDLLAQNFPLIHAVLQLFPARSRAAAGCAPDFLSPTVSLYRPLTAPV